ncbi:hypothetical protein CONPUDRAFT_161999 [Coniophora puteana RWD-64-598 SS2]|uniref:RNI-like protein n=1 Tax=Coniophora puteana (strain RWD-64-598) TaxID=741705 RepID=A0A5M3MZP6_CONPW|nr:uncharacterized protein CONPUDRAFT_161999 [Coniophora puteana RWD-64-598 SS2]EIW84620.1 hypothetical protein CONPUDRAFT_161999 [Coniophora puteana RWD-64-598 SS2]
MPPYYLYRELLDKICNELWDEERVNDSGRDLARLAQACKVFQDPALDVLYYEIVGFESLFKILPRDSWSTDGGAFALTRPLRVCDWDVFRKNASRIRRLSQPMDTPAITAEAFEAFCLCPHSPILPNLRHLMWENKSLFPGNLLRLLCGPKLTHLDFPFIPRSFMSIISTICIGCHDLRYLSVGPASRKDFRSFLTMVEDALGYAPALRVINLRSKTTVSFFETSSKLPCLQELDVQSLHKMELVSPPASNGVLFPLLQSLGFSQTPLGDISTTLSFLGLLPSLDSFSASMCTTGLALDIACLLKTLGFNVNPQKFTDLSVEGDLTEGIADALPLTMECLKPLMLFANIQNISITTTAPFSLEDGDIRTLSASWPNLQSIEFGGCKRLHGHKKPTVQGLATLLTNCPLLEDADLVVDMRLKHNLSPKWLNCGPNVERLHLGFSPLDDPIYVASALNFLMPGLTKMWAWEDDMGVQAPGAHGDQWAEVKRLVTGFNARETYRRQWLA